jgi:hypothetical protein
MPNIQIQKARAESASQSNQALPASDLERSVSRRAAVMHMIGYKPKAGEQMETSITFQYKPEDQKPDDITLTDVPSPLAAGFGGAKHWRYCHYSACFHSA